MTDSIDFITSAFWASLAAVLYTYIGYPFMLWLNSGFYREIDKASLTPKITIIIAAWNEGPNIARRLDNLLNQDYPVDKMEIIIVSDGSTDNTSAIVKSYNDKNVCLVELEERGGKALALNHGMKHVRHDKSDIVVFTDARQHFESGALRNLVACFNDPQIGCVSGELVFVRDGVSKIQAEMGAYWNYEKWIRKMESRTGSVVGATGAIYAIRRRLFIPLPPDTILDDVLIPLSIVQQGYRSVFESGAVAFDTFSEGVEQEWYRKVRTLAGNWQLLGLLPTLFLPWSNPCWWRFISHKIMRLIVPLFLAILFVSGALNPGLFYRTATFLQILFYFMALAACFEPALRKNRVTSLIYFFMVMNSAAVAGFLRWVTGASKTAWHPSYSVDKVR